MKERDYIAWLRGVLSSSYVGDDTAVVKLDDPQMLFTTDLLVEGTHFLPGAEPALIGRKAVAVSLSDIAAMGGSPVCAVISVCLRRGTGEEFARELFLGAKAAADEYGLEIVGGDTTSSETNFSVCTAVVGRAHATGPIMRSGARDGDRILVTGTLGGSVRGRHFTFSPRVREAAAILAAARPTAMIDVSDGLACDLGHVVEESGVGAVLVADGIPISNDARACAGEDGKSALEHALDDGEDFELLLTVSDEDCGKLLDLDLDCGLSEIGRMGGQGVRLVSPSGEERSIAGQGYEHTW